MRQHKTLPNPTVSVISARLEAAAHLNVVQHAVDFHMVAAEVGVIAFKRLAHLLAVAAETVRHPKLWPERPRQLQEQKQGAAHACIVQQKLLACLVVACSERVPSHAWPGCATPPERT